jgi:hypothetical protein
MRLTFAWQETQGNVDVECRANDDPDKLGCFPGATGFPACTATVTFPNLGYRSMLGWVQLVRSTDNAGGGREFESDPFALFGDAPSPYCWYGQNPRLFDGPYRPLLNDMEWVAHSFLAATPLDEVMAFQPRRVVPLSAFSWGFTIAEAALELLPLEPLPLEQWNVHAPVLRAQFPFWQFTDV